MIVVKVYNIIFFVVIVDFLFNFLVKIDVSNLFQRMRSDIDMKTNILIN